MKTVRLKEPMSDFYRKTIIAIVIQCFSKAMPTETYGTLSTGPALKEEEFLIETWKKRQSESHLKTETTKIIKIICDTVTSRINESSIDPNHPHHLMCFEFIYWLAMTLSAAPRNKDSAASVNKRIDYINFLLKSEAISVDNVDDQEIRMMLNSVKTALRNITPLLKPETPLTHLQRHLTTIETNGKAIIDNGTRFLYYIFSNTSNPPLQNIAKLLHSDSFHQHLATTRSGELLSVLIQTPQFIELFKGGNDQSPKTSPRSPPAQPGAHRKLSLRQKQTLDNPFLTITHQLCIPQTILKRIDHTTPTLIEYFQCQANMTATQIGIHSPFLNKPNLLETFFKMHALLPEASKVLLACSEAKDLCEEDSDFLESENSITQIIGLMERLKELCGALKACKNKLLDCGTQTWEILSKKDATQDPSNTAWLKNISQISSIASEGDQALERCSQTTDAVKILTKTIPTTAGKKTAKSNTQQFEQATEMLNQHARTTLDSLLISPTPSPPSSPSAQRKNSPTRQRQSSPTPPIKANAPPEKEKRQGRLEKIREGMAMRRKQAPDRQPVPASTFVIPEPTTRPASPEKQDTSVATVRPPSPSTQRPAPPKQSPILIRQAEATNKGNQPPQQNSLTPPGSPVITRKLSPEFSRTRETKEQGAYVATLYSETHSPKPTRTQEVDSKATESPRLRHSPTQPTNPISHSLVLFGIKKATTSQPLRCVSDNEIGDVIKQISPHTTEIDLQRNELSGIGANQLCQFLETHPHLASLNLSRNKKLFNELLSDRPTDLFPFAGAMALSKLLATQKTLKELWLSECRLTSVCATILANGLKSNASLEFLDLGCNQFCDKGASAIFNALLRHPTICHLAIDKNDLTDTSGKKLLELLQKNTRLTHVKIDETKFSPEMSGQIEKQAKMNWEEQEARRSPSLNK